jgi:hypothetical protein
MAGLYRVRAFTYWPDHQGTTTTHATAADALAAGHARTEPLIDVISPDGWIIGSRRRIPHPQDAYPLPLLTYEWIETPHVPAGAARDFR